MILCNSILLNYILSILINNKGNISDKLIKIYLVSKKNTTTFCIYTNKIIWISWLKVAYIAHNSINYKK